MANFNATTGVDNVDLGNGTDSVTVTNTNQIQIGDYFQGGNGTDDIIISGASGVSVNLSGAGTTAGTSGFNDFERLVFNNTSGTSGATLSSGQFSGSLIDPNLAIVGAAGAQAVFVSMAATGSFSLAGWTFNTWASGTDTITVNGTGGADTIIGSTVNDTLNGGSGADSITGGTGADTMSGGSASDTFFFAAGDAALTIGGSAMAGTVSGYDVITDFAAGATAAASEKIDFATSSQVAGNGTTNGNNSALQLHTGNVVSSHSITNGIITFDDTGTFAAAVPLTSLSDVAAVAQYLENNDNGNFNIGDVVAFKAIISGVTHTYIWRGSNGTESSNILIDLVNVDATSIVESGDQISVIAPTGPTAPSITSIAENAGGGINASEAADGTAVVVSLTGTGAVASDTLTINWGGQTVNYVLTAADAIAGSATVTVPAGTITTQGNGTFNVTAKLNAGPNSSAVSVMVDTVLPAVPTDTNGATNQVAENAANGAAVGLTANSTDTNAITYSITSDSSGGAFTIHTSTGVVTVANGSLLDYEAATSHTITIRATR